MQITGSALLISLVFVAVTGCGGGNTATVTVTAAAPAAAPPPEPSESSGPTGANKPVGPPLPAGVVGVDGRYLLKTDNSDYDEQNIGPRYLNTIFGRDPSHAATKCVGKRCSVTLRLALLSGGFKAYTLPADPARQRTYVGTGRGPIECLDDKKTVVPYRQRVAVRAESPKDIAGRQVAGRLSVYITTRARCKNVINGKPDQSVKTVYTLRGPRQP